MSWFEYDSATPRSLRKGVCLRIRSIPAEILAQWSEICQPRTDEWLDRVEVLEVLPRGKVILRCWSRVVGVDPFDRHVVVEFMTDEDSTWICEGDIGRGHKPDRPKQQQKKTGSKKR